MILWYAVSSLAATPVETTLTHFPTVLNKNKPEDCNKPFCIIQNSKTARLTILETKKEEGKKGFINVFEGDCCCNTAFMITIAIMAYLDCDWGASVCEGALVGVDVKLGETVGLPVPVGGAEGVGV